MGRKKEDTRYHFPAPFKPNLIDFLNLFYSDASSANIRILKSLGAVIADVFNEDISHFVCSNASTKRLRAAAIFEIIVVNPLWVENCFQSGSRVAEADFTVSQEVVGTSNTGGSSVQSILPKKTIEPIVEEEKLSRRLSSPHYSSSKQEESSNFDKPKKGKKPAKETAATKEFTNVPPKNFSSSLAIIQEKNAHCVESSKISVDQDSEDNENVLVHGATAKKSATEISCLDFSVKTSIPLPSYKAIHAIVRSGKPQARRSERILDNVDSLEDVLQIDTDMSLPIVRISEYSPNANRSVINDQCSKSTTHKISSQNCEHAIKEPAGKNVLSKTLKSDEMTSSNLTKTNVTQINASVPPAISSNFIRKDAAKGPKTKKVNAVSNVDRSNVVPDLSLDSTVSGIDTYAVSTGGQASASSNIVCTSHLVIAISGFDELGEKETIINGLSHFIATIDAAQISKEKIQNDKNDKSSSSSKKVNAPTGNKNLKNDGTSSLLGKITNSSTSGTSTFSTTSTSSSAVILGSDDDIYGKDCTHVILHSSSSK